MRNAEDVGITSKCFINERVASVRPNKIEGVYQKRNVTFALH